MGDRKRLTGMLKKEIDFIFKNDEAFMHEFALMEEYIDLVEVSFSNTSVKFVYVSSEGAHIVDLIPLDDYYEWKDKQ